MRSGTSFRLRNSVLVVESTSGKRECVLLPPGAVIRVRASYRTGSNPMVTVECNSRTFDMFAVDIEERAEVVAQADADGHL